MENCVTKFVGIIGSQSEGRREHASLVATAKMVGIQAVIPEFLDIDDGIIAVWEIHRVAPLAVRQFRLSKSKRLDIKTPGVAVDCNSDTEGSWMGGLQGRPGHRSWNWIVQRRGEGVKGWEGGEKNVKRVKNAKRRAGVGG